MENNQLDLEVLKKEYEYKLEIAFQKAQYIETVIRNGELDEAEINNYYSTMKELYKLREELEMIRERSEYQLKPTYYNYKKNQKILEDDEHENIETDEQYFTRTLRYAPVPKCR